MTTNNLIFRLRSQFQIDTKIKNVVIIKLHSIATKKNVLNVENVDQKLKQLQFVNDFEFDRSKKIEKSLK